MRCELCGEKEPCNRCGGSNEVRTQDTGRSELGQHYINQPASADGTGMALQNGVGIMRAKTYARLESIRARLAALQGGELSLGERRLVDAIKRDVTTCIGEEMADRLMRGRKRNDK